VRQAVCIEVIDAIKEFTDLDYEPQIGKLHDHLHHYLARHSLIAIYWRHQSRRRRSALINQALADLQVFTPDREINRSRFYEIAWGHHEVGEADPPEEAAP
jgi:hypothetical protein